MASRKKLQLKVKLLYNKQIKPGFWRMGLDCVRLAARCLPGQFVNVKVSDGCEPLLRRPFSVHQAKGGKVEILYEIVGNATQILSRKKRGEYLDIIGPLGNGFDYPSSVVRRPSSVVLIAGGMGVAPLIFLAEKLRGIQNPKSKIQILVLIGARAKNQVLCEQEFRKLGCQVKIATDDGSRGFKGKVTGLLEKFLRSIIHHPLSIIYACGPRPMLKEVSRIARNYKIPAQISLEEHMSCGIGACMGCVVKTKKGYQRVCKEGPVFEADQILWEG